MDQNPNPGTESPPGPPRRRAGGLSRRAATAVTAAGLMTGGVVGGVMIANAATSSDTSTAAATPSPSTGTGSSGSSGSSGTAQPSFDPTKGGHVGANGVVEQLLTGDTATKVRAAALAAVPGGTIERVENDAEGSPYEAHMVKSDGTHVTVKVDSSFKVTSVDTDAAGGHGGPPTGSQSGA